jgi:hypothetical protein
MLAIVDTGRSSPFSTWRNDVSTLSVRNDGQGLARPSATLAGFRQQIGHVAFAAGAQAYPQRNREQYGPDLAHAYVLPTAAAIYRKSVPTARATDWAAVQGRRRVNLALPAGVSTTRDDRIAPPFSRRTRPSQTASSQIDKCGQVLLHASMASP